MTVVSTQEQLHDYYGRPSEWRDEVYCSTIDDINVMLPKNGAGVEIAKEVCRKCVVREVCLDLVFATGCQLE